ncbi:MAG: DinB family protein [Bryobacteraceae bacterium]|nr:DinB family protein [Bryobacteraceae bacterium]
MMNASPASLSLAQQAVEDLNIARQRFNRSTSNLTEPMSGFSPADGMMTTAQHVAHAARVIDWFVEGAFRPEGFDMNFEEQIKAVLAVKSLTAARDWFEQSTAGVIELLASKSDPELTALLPLGPVLGGMPRIGIIREIVDHTAHHRGALTTYARLNNIVPADPYGM